MLLVLPARERARDQPASQPASQLAIMDFMRKRKLNALLNGLGSRPATTTETSQPAPDTAATHDFDSTPQTPPSHRNSTATAASPSPSTIHTPASDSMALKYSASSAPRSSTTVTTNNADLDLLTKRRRLGLPDSTPSKNLAANTTIASPTANGNNGGQTTISNIVLRKWSGNSNKDRGQGTIFKPKYCPGDRDELLKRLASFQELTDWTPKPDPVNEIEWAKRGWVCQGKERVRCTLCNKELVVKLNRKEVDGREIAVLVASEIEEALVRKYVELIVSSHQDECLWRKRGCDDSLIRLPLSNRQGALRDLRKRYDELCARKAFLPYEFNLRLPDKLKLNTILTQLPPDFFSSPPAPPTNPSAMTPNRVALALAILGWQGLDNPRIGPVPNTASCHTCLRRLGLWMFKSKEVDLETSTVLVPAPMDHLDPLREHRFFCPWKNADAQRTHSDVHSRRSRLGDGEEEKAGWEVLVQVIKNEAYLRSRETPGRSSTYRGGSDGPHTPSRGSVVGRERLDSPLPATPDGTDGEVLVDEDDEKAEAAKDKERWARLRRVKSLLQNKGARKLRKSFSATSRPGTSQSGQPGEGTPTGGGTPRASIAAEQET